MSKSDTVQITSGALSEGEGPTGIVLRGEIAPDSLRCLKIDAYQREARSPKQLRGLIQAFTKGESVPDIELGMRGQRYRSKTAENDYMLQDEVYIVDGLQRFTAAMQAMRASPDIAPRLGATVFFNTNYDWERQRFTTLNSGRTPVAPSVHLRNLCDENNTLAMLHKLNEERRFALCGKVSWGQNMKRSDLVTARVFCHTVGRLHAHKSSGGRKQAFAMAEQLEKLSTTVGENILRDNVITFFDTIDDCWTLRSLQHKDLAVHTRSTFLFVLANVFSAHHNFWKNAAESRLFVDSDMRRKIGSFPLHEPAVAKLASSAGQAGEMLYQMLCRHLDSGKRSNKLRPRMAVEHPFSESDAA